jgi:hypothetical protein
VAIRALPCGPRVNSGSCLRCGAQTLDVRRLVPRHRIDLATLGVVVGIAGALYLTGFPSAIAVGVTPVNWATPSAVGVILAATATLASYSQRDARGPCYGAAIGMA